MKGRGGCVRSFGHEHDFGQAEKAENTDPHTNYAVKYATARGHLTLGVQPITPTYCLAAQPQYPPCRAMGYRSLYPIALYFSCIAGYRAIPSLVWGIANLC